MAKAGLLGSVVIETANAWTQIYMVPATGVDFTHGTIHIHNPNATTAMIGLGGTYGSSPSTKLEGSTGIPGNGGIYFRDCLTFGPNEKVMVRSSVVGVEFEFRGLEQAPA